MYLSFYGLREAPFAPTPDPKFLFQSARHREALAQLIYGVRDNLDVGLVVPFLRNDLTVWTDAQVVHARGSPPSVHRFDLETETPGQMGAAHAVGIGDMVLRAKYQVDRFPFDLAILGSGVQAGSHLEMLLPVAELALEGRVDRRQELGVRATPGDLPRCPAEHRRALELHHPLGTGHVPVRLLPAPREQEPQLFLGEAVVDE